MKSLIVALCAGSLFALAACHATLYHPVSGNKLFEGEIEDHPSPERARELYDLLEDGLLKNLEALREAIQTNNTQAQELCMANIEKAAQWKQHLASLIIV